MKYTLLTGIALLFTTCCLAQSTYTAASYATVNDTFYLTDARIDTTNYINSGANHNWNFATLQDNSQEQLLFRSPRNTGYTQLQWPYLYNANNVNLSSTNGQTTALGTFTLSNNNDYFLQSSGSLVEKASSFNFSYNNLSFNIKNVYTSADTIYKYPLHYMDSAASLASYTTTIPGLYYNTETIYRTNTVDGWGTVTTPYGTFTHCLRVVSNVIQNDTFAITSIGIPAIVTQYRELKWLDSTKAYPVLYVKQAKTGNTYITQAVKYYDIHKYFQPQALFAFVPLQPGVNDTLTFQNLSTNALNYSWNFGDGNSSTDINPQHTYTATGTYTITLVAYNGPLADTARFTIQVTNQPSALFTFSPLLPVVSDTVSFLNLSKNALSYTWIFGDGGNSTNANPSHKYQAPGTYTVMLIAHNNALADTLLEPVIVSAVLPLQLLSFTGSYTGSANRLQWTTASEINTAYFGIEHSTDGLHFSTLNNIKATGNGVATTTYQFDDSSNTSGIQYYRLQMTDRDGQYVYSNIVYLNDPTPAGKTAYVFPNPAAPSQNIQLYLSTTSAATAMLTITDLSGKIMRTQQVSLSRGNNTCKVPSAGLPSGLYVVHCGDASVLLLLQ